MGFRVADPDLPAQKATADRSNGDDLTARLAACTCGWAPSTEAYTINSLNKKD
jgi:hypothetical protein